MNNLAKQLSMLRDEQEDFRRKYGDVNQIRASLDLAAQTQ
jgi:hypothetical protein